MSQSNMALPGGRDRSLAPNTGILALVAFVGLGSGCLQDRRSPIDDADPDGASDGGPEWSEGTTGSDGSGSDGNGSAGASDDGAPADVDECISIQDEALAVLEANCAGCHNDADNKGGFSFVTDVDLLVASQKIVPGDPAGSPLFARMDSGSMPPGDAAGPSADDLELVRGWIDACVTDGGGAELCDNEWITTAEVVELMLDDISSVPADDRRFTRYLTLTHLHNVGACDEDLETYRYGLSKAINSMSLDPLISRPEAIDQWGTIYRIDLRDYDWEAAKGVDKWELLVDNNPYAFRMIDDEAELLQELAETDVPFMTADWLVHDASEPPLYYDLVDMPSSVGQLEARLGINRNANISNREVDRAGFLNSGVSQSNRMFERHQLPTTPGGAYWLSYDFSSNAGQQNLLANPLDFAHEGETVIFNLPNGLQGYAIADAHGTVLGEASVALLSDPLQPDKVMRAGISCMSCHDAGLEAKQDEVREYVLSSLEFDSDEKELVADLYPPAAEMEGLLDLGNQTFANAVNLVWDAPAGSGEPIMAVFAKFEYTVDLDRAAAELGVTPADLRAQLGELDPTYAPLNGSVIDRDTFEAKFAESVCLLNLGVADDPACGNGN